MFGSIKAPTDKEYFRRKEGLRVIPPSWRLLNPHHFTACLSLFLQRRKQSSFTEYEAFKMQIARQRAILYSWYANVLKKKKKGWSFCGLDHASVWPTHLPKAPPNMDLLSPVLRLHTCVHFSCLGEGTRGVGQILAFVRHIALHMNPNINDNMGAPHN